MIDKYITALSLFVAGARNCCITNFISRNFSRENKNARTHRLALWWHKYIYTKLWFYMIIRMRYSYVGCEYRRIWISRYFFFLKCVSLKMYFSIIFQYFLSILHILYSFRFASYSQFFICVHSWYWLFPCPFCFIILYLYVCLFVYFPL